MINLKTLEENVNYHGPRRNGHVERRFRNGHLKVLMGTMEITEENFDPNILATKFLELYRNWFIKDAEERLIYVRNNDYLNQEDGKKALSTLSGAIGYLCMTIAEVLDINFGLIGRYDRNPIMELTDEQIVTGLSKLLGVDITLEQ